MHRRIRNSFARIVVYAALSHLTSSCVLIPIPYVPESDVTIQMEGELPSDKMILDFTSGGIVYEIAEVIESETPRIEIVNAQDHKDVIFPGQDQWVSSFFKEGNCRRIAQELNVDYAILITGLHRIELQSRGRGLEFGGAGYSQAEETLSAAIIDMRSALLLSKLKVDTEDSFAELGFVVIPSVFPLGGKYSVQHVIGKEIASALLARSDKSKLRIVVFGLVDSGDNSIAVVKKHLLRKRLASGDEAYEIKRGLADLGDYQPFEALAESGDAQAAAFLYRSIGDIRPLRKLVEQGNSRAKIEISAIEREKQHAAQLADLDRRKYEQADDAVDAQYQLYYSIKGDERLFWLCRAADNGNPSARYRVAMLYEYGIEGVSRDEARAQMWYRLAAISGNVWGDSNADRLANDATEGESTQMQKLLRNWQPGQCEAEILMGKNSD